MGTGKWFLIDRLQPAVSGVLLAARTPELGDLTTEAVDRAWNRTHHELRAVIVRVWRVLTDMSIIPSPSALPLKRLAALRLIPLARRMHGPNGRAAGSRHRGSNAEHVSTYSPCIFFQ